MDLYCDAGKKSFYYPYNSDYIDVGWGCAWRSIQMLVSHFIVIDFKALVNSFYTF